LNQLLSEKMVDLSANQKETDVLRSELNWARREPDTLRSELNWARRELDTLRAEIATVRSEREHSRSQLSQSLAEIESARNAAENFRREYINVLYSRSYRITAPMREFYVFLSKLRKAVRPEMQEQFTKPPSKDFEGRNELAKDVQYFRGYSSADR
jgi:septal ring factor EnvC (AmiA/AmiB activator)